MDRKELAARTYNISHLTGNFTLRSGQVSSEYFDKYLFESDPVLLTDIASEMAKLVPEGTEILAGLEMGAIPVATAISIKTGIPAVFVRKKAKEYGSSKKIEAEVTSTEDALKAAAAGADIVMLDNFSPEQVREAVEALKKAGFFGKVLLEVSGGITEQNLLDYASAQVDIVSMGALTHSVKALDTSLEISAA